MEQRSAEWFAWRQKHIGASDVPSIMGTSDFGNPHGVFIAKTQGALKDSGFNFAAQRGISLEPVIISKVEEHLNLRLAQPSLTYAEWPILSASLDGWCPVNRILVEVKAPAIWKHTMALCGFVPDTYVDQLQAQLLVAGAEYGIYASYHDLEPEGFDLAVFRVDHDKERQEQILSTCQKFWAMVESGVWNENWRS